MTGVLLRANPELVAVAWLSTATGVPAGGVATTLPADNSTWAASGFVQVTAAPGGSANVDVPLRRPILTIDCWANNPNSGRPPWGKAAYLAETVYAAFYDTQAIPRDLTLPAGYPGARVLSAVPLGEPRRLRSDPSSYARFGFDAVLHWIELPA